MTHRARSSFCRLVPWLVALAVVAPCAARAASATMGESTYDGITWTYTVVSSTAPKTAKLVGSSFTPCITPSYYSGEVSIPATFANKVYTNILLDTYAFINCANVTKFSIPATVTDVYGAFQNCTALTTISFAAPKITFNGNAFVNCPSFTAFELTGEAAANYAVEGGALYNLTKTQLVRAPMGLSNVTIPDTVTAIGQNAFAHSAVRSLALPAALQGISVSAFTTASQLESFSIPDANPTYATRNGVLYSKDLKTLVRVPPACTNLTVLAGVTNIADNACIACAALKSVTCPASLKRLETYAFSGATSIKTITFKGDLPTLRAQDTLGNLTYDAIIRYPSRYAENWKTYLDAHNYKLHEPVANQGCIIIFSSAKLIRSIPSLSTYFLQQRNAERFPEGYIVQLSYEEFQNWKSQIVTSNLSAAEKAAIKMGMRRAPYAFTEKGVYMLATILKGERAVKTTIKIIETYAELPNHNLAVLKITHEVNRTPKGDRA